MIPTNRFGSQMVFTSNLFVYLFASCSHEISLCIIMSSQRIPTNRFGSEMVSTSK